MSVYEYDTISRESKDYDRTTASKLMMMKLIVDENRKSTMVNERLHSLAVLITEIGTFDAALLLVAFIDL